MSSTTTVVNDQVKGDVAREKSFDWKIGVIGAGNMAKALVHGFITCGKFSPENLLVIAPSNRNLPYFSKMGCKVDHNSEAMHEFNCRFVFVCVKPAVLMKYVTKTQVFFHWCGDHLISVISVVAGVSIGCLSQVFKSSDKSMIKFYRIMINTACSIGCGTCAITPEQPIDSPSSDEVFVLLSDLALCECVPEDQLDAVTALSGSGIAFGYTFIQAMADGAVKQGLGRSVALKFAAQTLLGAAKMVNETGTHPIELRDKVCSPSGTTICGIHELEKAGFNAAVMNAIDSAAQRARQ